MQAEPYADLINIVARGTGFKIKLRGRHDFAIISSMAKRCEAVPRHSFKNDEFIDDIYAAAGAYAVPHEGRQGLNLIASLADAVKNKGPLLAWTCFMAISQNGAALPSAYIELQSRWNYHIIFVDIDYYFIYGGYRRKCKRADDD